MHDVMIVRCSGCRNSRCMPRPIKDAFSIEPPQLDPSICTSTGSGQNVGMSGNQRLPVAAIHQRIRAVLRLHAQHRALRQPVQEHPALHLRGDEVVVHAVPQVGVRPEQVRHGHADFGIHSTIRSYFNANSGGHSGENAGCSTFRASVRRYTLGRSNYAKP